MTISKSQGQTLKKVGVWLIEPVFGHGQLYVAGSRVGSPESIKFSIKNGNVYDYNYTKNIVFKEILI